MTMTSNKSYLYPLESCVQVRPYKFHFVLSPRVIWIVL